MYHFDDKRLEKLQALRDSGVEPYPHGLRAHHTAAQVQDLIGDRCNEALQQDDATVTVAGRVLFKNEMGKAGFARIQDRSGRIQVYVRRNDVGEDAFDKVWKKLDLGDHVLVTGRLMRTRTGEPSIHAGALRLASKCIASLPDKHKGIEDPEFRARQRYVDLFMDEASRETFVRRSRLLRYVRDYFESHGFLEVETPMMQVIPGGAAARPFVTHHNALDIDLYLRVAPELFLKRLVVGGLERVFEINRNFRNEGVSTRHNPEFTMLEFYQAYATWEDLMALTEDLVSGAARAVTGSTKVPFGDVELDFTPPWRRLRFDEAVAEALDLPVARVLDPAALRARWLELHPNAEDMPTTVGRWFELVFDVHIEERLVQPTFLTHFPTEISPLSRRNDADPSIVDRFELIVAGREIANGFNELNDPVDQAERFLGQVAERASGDDEAMFFDADYIRALSYGMPPTAGEGIGIDRLAMLLCDRQSIREVILFPTLRPEQGIGAPPAASDDEGGC